MPNRARLARERAHAEVSAEIRRVARDQLAEVGAPALSLRAVAREMGMAPSALFRYLPNKDALLTALIIESYDELGEAAEQAEAAVHTEPVTARWSAICHAVRRWALDHPHEYALVYGSPVPGYVAPQDTVGPATRVARLLSALLGDALREGLEPPTGPPTEETAARLHATIAPVRADLPDEVPDELVVRGLMAWTYLFGAVSFEVFGHRTFGVLDDPAAFFDYEAGLVARLLGIMPT
ncbi:TetR/AcrR family transcriptional regulator [Actinotalea sp. M2MS4P-6]|uniref:TetR/AcrR family transcriptional regulator n=1 Tax=Actinotalea sp. M2MS4P-6 TaxID=2983762 RepID=UPI0021E41673|nr:TetR/AcrR family transcriptional regulator [Actinotalea sp. M2MS4P-6]MCV2396006.1 TetR/AcrR family transcriptional regulator [Actinotalea sp. M2MS4P-6]